MLTPELQRRVLNAIHFNPDSGDVVALVELLETGEELHQFVFHYNCNDGLLPYHYIIQNPKCDLGTALFVYWQLADFVFEFDDVTDDYYPNWNGSTIVKEIENRMANQFYTSQHIQFSPMEFLDLTETSVKRMRVQNDGKLPFPDRMLKTTPGTSIQRQSLTTPITE